jgi:adenylate cyclase
MPAPRAARTLQRLLDDRNEHPERIAKIDREIRTRFQQRHAVMVLDMCGFSRLTLQHGIVHFLAMIRRMHAIVGPIIEKAKGRVVKTEADNVFAVFPDVPQALAAAARIGNELSRTNAVLPQDWDLHVSTGIGYGKLLMVGHDDFYGAELNLAAKLGEDVAGPGEVLLTDAARARARRITATPRRVRVGSLTVSCHRLRG